MTPPAAAVASQHVESPPTPTPRTSRRKVVQIGCGVVGHAYAQAFVENGHDVLGIEASHSRIEHCSLSYRMRHVSEDLSDEDAIDFILLSINTPLDKSTGALSMRYLWSSLDNVEAMLRTSPNAMVVIRSTVTLGFCARYRSALEERLGNNSSGGVRLCFQPEFLRAKSALQDARSPWHVVIGCTAPEQVTDYADFQAEFIDRSRISFCRVDEAEVMKLFHNSFNAMKISYFNQAAMLIDRVNERDGSEMNAAKTFSLISKTCEGLLNPMYGLSPGHAYYGSCLPKDSAELANMEKQHNMECNLFGQVVNVNHVVQQTDAEEVVHGDNHVDSKFFHRATESSSPKRSMDLSMLSLPDAEKLTDSSTDSS